MTRLAVIVALAGALLFTLTAPDTARDAVRFLFDVAAIGAAAVLLTFVAAVVMNEGDRFRLRRRELREHRTDHRAALRLVEPSNVVDLAGYVSSRGPERAA